jgi:type II secretory pathway component GspD/PulD (secretin)
MTLHSRFALAATLFGLFMGATLTAGQQSPASTSPTVTALMVEVTVNRYQGDKRLSSIPYVLAVTPDKERATLRVGGEIPIQRLANPSAKDQDATPAPSFGYRSIGTNIDVSAAPAADGRYRLAILLEETSVYADDSERSISKAPAVAASGLPSFRNLRASNAVMLKDGQSLEFTAASDRISGEVARIAVKLTVVP